MTSQYPGTRKDTVRDSGIDIIGDVGWRTHFCLFYKTRDDLIDVLVPYFDAGLRNNEFCMCITSEPFNAEEVRGLMSEAIPGFDEYLRKGQIEIIPHTEWYKKDGVFRAKTVINGWVEKLHQAMAHGFDGLRLTGNTSWLEKSSWKDFLDYEQELNETIDQYNLIAMCNYSLDQCSAGDILDVAGTHQFAMTRCEGEWKVIQNKQVCEDRERLLNELRKLSMAVEQSPATVVITDTHGKIEYVNPKFIRLTGYTPEEAIGQNPRVLKSGETPPAVYEELWETILSGKEWHGEFHNKKKNGELYWESALIAPVKDDSGKIKHFIAVKEDITERKRAEQELKEAKMHADLYLDLMGHDINNLNQIALGYLELANELVTDEKIRECLSKPLDAIHSSTYLIENVGKLQKVKSGELKTELIDLNDILTVIQAQYSKIPDKEVTITFVPRNKSIVMANGLIKDLFSNLAWNSIKHSNGASVLINLDLERQQKDGNAYYKVIVEDNGPGISDTQKEKIFARFQRGNTKASGKGLGLYLVKTLVENFKGSVWVEDRISGDHTKGAKFVVMLPASK